MEKFCFVHICLQQCTEVVTVLFFMKISGCMLRFIVIAGIAFPLPKIVQPNRPPLWSSGQSSWLQIRRPEFDSRHYQKKNKVVGLERGPLSLVSTTEELLDRKVAAPV
jgi:hypothetical protein